MVAAEEEGVDIKTATRGEMVERRVIVLAEEEREVYLLQSLEALEVFFKAEAEGRREQSVQEQVELEDKEELGLAEAVVVVV